MKRMHKLVHRNKDGKVLLEKIVKRGESPSDRLLNLLLNKDIVLIEGDTVTVEEEWVEDDKAR